jgi:hypothetical protein
MPAKGERSHPLEGVKGSKKRLPKLPRAPEAADLAEQSSIYLVERNQAMRLKRMREEMLLARERGQLIERELVTKQLRSKGAVRGRFSVLGRARGRPTSSRQILRDRAGT